MSGPALAMGGAAVEQVVDWCFVVLAFLVLAATEGAAPREGYIPKSLLQSTSYPLRANTVPAWSVPLYTLALPVALFALHALLWRRPAAEARQLSLGLLAAVSVTAAVTNLIKCPVGRLRPDFNARCAACAVCRDLTLCCPHCTHTHTTTLTRDTTRVCAGAGQMAQSLGCGRTRGAATLHAVDRQPLLQRAVNRSPAATRAGLQLALAMWASG
jgi:hypothetical protein